MFARARSFHVAVVVAITSLGAAVFAADKPRLFGGRSDRSTERQVSKDGFRFDPARVEQITGFKGTVHKDVEPVFKVTMPREDVKITVRGLPISEFMGLTSWAGFQQLGGGNIMLMGDLVLYPDEVNPVMDVLFKNRIEVSALNTRYFHDEPRVYFMRIAGADSNVEPLATAVRKAFDEIQRLREAQPNLNASTIEAGFSASAIEAGKLDAVFKTRGQTQDGMYKVVVGRLTKMPCGCPIGQNMGINTWAAFAGTNSNAIATGQIAAADGELQPTLKSLRENGINIVGIHNGPENEVPRYQFVSFWARGNAEEIALALRTTLDKQKAAKE